MTPQIPVFEFGALSSITRKLSTPNLENDSMLSEKEIQLKCNLLTALGKSGLGVVAILGVPKVQELTKQVLPMGQCLATLSPESRALKLKVLFNATVKFPFDSWLFSTLPLI